jgi:cobalamin-dependent methionine synthase I
MQTRYDLNALFLLVLLGGATAAEAQVQPELAKRYFEEATKLCERDAGRLWGVSTLVVAEARLRAVWSPLRITSRRRSQESSRHRGTRSI